MKRFLGAILLVIGTVGVSQPSAAVMIFTDTDLSGFTTNSEDAFASWSAAVGTIQTDILTGLSCLSDVCMTDASNTFTGFTNLIAIPLTTGVVAGDVLQLNPEGPTGFLWEFSSLVSAFGFFTNDNDGGIVTIEFFDTKERSFSFKAEAGDDDNAFWGITGLAGPISSVTILIGDGDASHWDNFSVAAVPEPGAVTLFGVGLLVTGLALRRARH